MPSQEIICQIIIFPICHALLHERHLFWLFILASAAYFLYLSAEKEGACPPGCLEETVNEVKLKQSCS
jgi:hypothetical protein